MFGNIDENGQLEDDILDSNAKQHLSSLSQLGIGSFLLEMMSEEAGDKKEDEPKTEENGKEPVENGEVHDKDNKDVDYHAKDPEALDFSYINELADDCVDPPQGISNRMKSEREAGYDTDDYVEYKQDKEETSAMQRKLKTPLASLLPSKYANVDVTELFPHFRPQKVLRFSKLFGPGKPSSLPQTWRGVKKRRKKKQLQQCTTEDSDDEWTMNYGPDPTPDQLADDDEDVLLMPAKDEDQEKNPGDTDENDMGPKVADWRFGPAKIWYDALGVPETGEGFNYGFKLAEKVEEETPAKDDHVDEDAFLMVSQLHWEDDVMWNAEDVKQKPIEKVNERIEFAGWAPSSEKRRIEIKTDGPDDEWSSIFPCHNEDLLNGSWEEDVIWDHENMVAIPVPKLPTYDLNDSNLILEKFDFDSQIKRQPPSNKNDSSKSVSGDPTRDNISVSSSKEDSLDINYLKKKAMNELLHSRNKRRKNSTTNNESLKSKIKSFKHNKENSDEVQEEFTIKKVTPKLRTTHVKCKQSLSRHLLKLWNDILSKVFQKGLSKDFESILNDCINYDKLYDYSCKEEFYTDIEKILEKSVKSFGPKSQLSRLIHEIIFSYNIENK